MSRINIPTVEHAPEASKPLLAAVHKQLSMVPNLMKVVGNSAAALEGYLSLNGALAKGAIDSKLRERIALAIAEFNGCEYCLAAHTYLGKNLAKLDDAEIQAARNGRSADLRADLAVRFAMKVAKERGRVGDEDIAALRSAGFDNAGIVEIVLNVALNILTNYVNNVAQTDVDFPKADVRIAA
jgi:uncharacterized peroxidase-related enzyme